MEHAEYRVDDKSLLHTIYQRWFFDRLTPRIPASVSPNTLTLVGHALGVVAAGLCIAAAEGRPALYVASAVVLMASLTLDQLDGAHARRTGQCSRRGELLDHGLDGIRSIAVLIMTGVLLQMDGVTLGVFCALGSLTFASVFWEQMRTGALSLPKIGPIEGVTALALWEVMVAFLGEPTWLRFSTEAITVGTVVVGVVVLVHAVAVVPPLLRAHRRGVRVAEVMPLFAVVVVQLAFLPFGANPLVVASTMGLCCAHATCHFIILRHQASQQPVTPWSLHVAALPLLAIPVDAERAAIAACLIAAAGYALTVHRGWAVLGPEPTP